MKTLVMLTLLSLPHDRADWVNWGAGAIDASYTVAGLRDGDRERFNPTQSKVGNVALILGGKAVETAIAHKCHGKLCRAIPWVAAAGSMAATAYSIANSRPRSCIAIPSSFHATYSCR